MAPKDSNTNNLHRSKRNQDIPETDSGDEDAMNQSLRSGRQNIEDVVAYNRAARARSRAQDGSGDETVSGGEDDENPGEGSGDEENSEEVSEVQDKEEKEKEDKGKGKAKKDKDGEKDEKKVEKKVKVSKTPKITWDPQNVKKLLLTMLSNKCVPNKHKAAIAKTFREDPTPKSVQEQMAKMRKEQRQLLTNTGLDKVFGDFETRKKKHTTGNNDDEEAPVPDIFVDDSNNAEINLSDHTDNQVFDDFPVTWADLPVDLAKQVKAECEKRAQEMHHAAQVPRMLEMHRRNYARQLEREAANEAARTLLQIAAQGYAGETDSEDEAPGAKEVSELERRTKETLAGMQAQLDTLQDLTGSRPDPKDLEAAHKDGEGDGDADE